MELKFSNFEGEVFKIKTENKKKDLEYGIFRIKKKHMSSLIELIDLLIGSAKVSEKMREKIVKVISPRYEEINDSCWSEKSLPEEIGIEISKHDAKEIIKVLKKGALDDLLKERGYDPNEFELMLKNIK